MAPLAQPRAEFADGFSFPGSGPLMAGLGNLAIELRGFSALLRVKLVCGRNGS